MQTADCQFVAGNKVAHFDQQPSLVQFIALFEVQVLENDKGQSSSVISIYDTVVESSNGNHRPQRAMPSG
jgi:hypothetical protein